MNLWPDIIEGVAHLSDFVLKGFEGDLASSWKGSSLFGLLVVAIDSKVSEMDKGILDEHGLKAEFLRAQSGKAFLVDKGLERMKISNQHVDPHVELVSIQQ